MHGLWERKAPRLTGFVEQRSFWNSFGSFVRLWVVLILFLQAAIIVAWEGKEYPWQAVESRYVQVRVLIVFFTWSALRLLQSLLDAGMQYSLVSKETLWLGVRMVMKTVVAAGWIIVFAVFYAKTWAQENNDGGWTSKGNARVVNFLEVALVFILSGYLALALFIVPGTRNFLDETDRRIFYLLSWWFQSRIFVGHGLREGLVDNIKYSSFWILVLATKFSFSYFLQIKPMVAPSKALLRIKNLEYQWHEFFDKSNRIAVGLLWLPVVSMYLMDLNIWYSIYSSFYGVAVGLFSHLGEIQNIRQLRLRFQFFASAFKFNLMPEEQLLYERGMRNRFNELSQKETVRILLGLQEKYGAHHKCRFTLGPMFSSSSYLHHSRLSIPAPPLVFSPSGQCPYRTMAQSAASVAPALKDELNLLIPATWSLGYLGNVGADSPAHNHAVSVATAIMFPLPPLVMTSILSFATPFIPMQGTHHTLPSTPLPILIPSI